VTTLAGVILGVAMTDAVDNFKSSFDTEWKGVLLYTGGAALVVFLASNVVRDALNTHSLALSSLGRVSVGGMLPWKSVFSLCVVYAVVFGVVTGMKEESFPSDVLIGFGTIVAWLAALVSLLWKNFGASPQGSDVALGPGARPGSSMKT
jgi:hypothetical protein